MSSPMPRGRQTSRAPGSSTCLPALARWVLKRSQGAPASVSSLKPTMPPAVRSAGTSMQCPCSASPGSTDAQRPTSAPGPPVSAPRSISSSSTHPTARTWSPRRSTASGLAVGSQATPSPWPRRVPMKPSSCQGGTSSTRGTMAPLVSGFSAWATNLHENSSYTPHAVLESGYWIKTLSSWTKQARDFRR